VPHGFGEVVVVAFDLGDDALVGWPGHARLLSKVFALGEPAAPAPADESAQTAWSGKAYDSLADQLADALDQFPGASPARFWYLAAAAVVYALVVGPLDWYIVRRRPEWTWATFLATVALAAAGGYAVVHATKPNATLANEIAFVDVDLTAVPPDASGDLSSRSPAAARIRGSAWTCFYQGAAVTTDVDIIPRMPWSNSSADAVALAATPPMARLSLWDRSSTAAMAGLLPNRVLGPDSRVTYHAAGAISSLSRPAWSTQHVAGEWSFDAAAFPSVAALAPDAFGRVVGHVRNPLDEPLEQAVLLYGSFAHALGKLAPGQSIAIDGRGDWRSIESFLTRRRFNEDRETAERYDAAGFDLDRIGEIIGFYDAAGGRRYVGLDRGGFRRLDLTQQLRLGRAILLGKTSSAVRVAISASGSRDDDVGEADDAATPHRQTAWWRFLIRVSGANTPPPASAPAMPNRRRRP
jgi:hypothetical protein